MSRKFGKMLCGIWNDPDWLVLSDQAMVMYSALISQYDISAAGVLPLTERRWKSYLDGGLRAVTEALDELDDKGFLVIDEDTAEVLVRTFIKHDGRLENPTLRTSVLKAVEEIHSPRLRNLAHQAVHGEGPARRPHDPPSDGPSDGGSMEGRTGDVLVPTDVSTEEQELEPSNVEHEQDHLESIGESDSREPVDKWSDEFMQRRSQIITAEANQRADDRGDGVRSRGPYVAKVIRELARDYGEALDNAIRKHPHAPNDAIAQRIIHDDLTIDLTTFDETDAA